MIGNQLNWNRVTKFYSTLLFHRHFILRSILNVLKMQKTRTSKMLADCVWNVMVQAQKPDFVFRRKGRGFLNRRGCQFSLLLATEVCASAVVMLDTTCSEVVWRVLATHSIRQFHPHFPSRASPYAITFQLESKYMSILTAFYTKGLVY